MYLTRGGHTRRLTREELDKMLDAFGPDSAVGRWTSTSRKETR